MSDEAPVPSEGQEPAGEMPSQSKWAREEMGESSERTSLSPKKMKEGDGDTEAEEHAATSKSSDIEKDSRPTNISDEASFVREKVPPWRKNKAQRPLGWYLKKFLRRKYKQPLGPHIDKSQAPMTPEWKGRQGQDRQIDSKAEKSPESPCTAEPEPTVQAPQEPQVGDLTWDGDAFEYDEIDRLTAARDREHQINRLLMEMQKRATQVPQDQHSGREDAWRRHAEELYESAERLSAMLEEPQQEHASSSTPPAQAGEASSAVRSESLTSETFADIVTRIYEEHAPYNIPLVPQMIEMFRGYEERLVRELKARYHIDDNAESGSEEEARLVQQVAERLAAE